VLFVLKSEDGSLRFLIHSKIRQIVQGEDSAYIEELLQDFHGRAKRDPATLFKQLSSLGVGPLVTNQVGLDFSEHPSLVTQMQRFIQI
jgi:hypothetical protein